MSRSNTIAENRQAFIAYKQRAARHAVAERQDAGLRQHVRTLQSAYPHRSLADLARAGYDFSLDALIDQAEARLY